MTNEAVPLLAVDIDDGLGAGDEVTEDAKVLAAAPPEAVADAAGLPDEVRDGDVGIEE